MFHQGDNQHYQNIYKGNLSNASPNSSNPQLKNMYLIDKINVFMQKNKLGENNLLSADSDEGIIEMKNVCNNAPGNNIQNHSSDSVSNITSKISTVTKISSFDVLQMRHKITAIENILKIQYDYSQYKKGKLAKAINSQNFFITFVDYNNSIYRYFLLYNYLKKFDFGFKYLLCVRDNSLNSGTYSKFHIYVEYRKFVNLFYSQLKTRDVVAFHFYNNDIVHVMKTHGVVLDEFGEPKYKNKLNEQTNNIVQKEGKLVVLKNKMHRENDIEYFEKYYYNGFRKVYYFYGNNDAHFNDLLMMYLKYTKIKYDVVYYRNDKYEGFTNNQAAVAVFPYFSDNNIPLIDFVELITYHKQDVTFYTNNGPFKNNYKLIIIIGFKPPESLYIKLSRPDFSYFFNIYKTDAIKDIQTIHQIFNFKI